MTAMELFLTYHRVTAPEGAGSAYDVHPALFGTHLSVLARRMVEARDGFATLAGGGRVCLTFDDGTADHAGAARRLEEAGLRGTFFVVAGRLGAPGSLRREDVAALASRGHRIGSHGMTHTRLSLLSAAGRIDELRRSREEIEQVAGRPIDWFAPPAGDWSDAWLPECRKAGYRLVRTMRWGYAGRDQEVVPCLPVLSGCGAAAFARMLDGRAPLWPYRAKTFLKTVVGDAAYGRLKRLWVRGAPGASRSARPT